MKPKGVFDPHAARTRPLPSSPRTTMSPAEPALPLSLPGPQPCEGETEGEAGRSPHLSSSELASSASPSPTSGATGPASEPAKVVLR